MSLDNTHPCSFWEKDCFQRKKVVMDVLDVENGSSFFLWERCTRLPSCHFYIYVDISFCDIFNLKINVTNCVSSMIVRKQSMIFLKTDDPIGCLPFMILCFPLRYHRRVNLICIHYRRQQTLVCSLQIAMNLSSPGQRVLYSRNTQDYCESGTRTMMTMGIWKMEKMLMRKMMLRRGNDSQESFPASTVMTRRGWEKEERKRRMPLFSSRSHLFPFFFPLCFFLSISSSLFLLDFLCFILCLILIARNFSHRKKASPLHENGRQCITIFSPFIF